MISWTCCCGIPLPFVKLNQLSHESDRIKDFLNHRIQKRTNNNILASRQQYPNHFHSSSGYNYLKTRMKREIRQFLLICWRVAESQNKKVAGYRNERLPNYWGWKSQLGFPDKIFWVALRAIHQLGRTIDYRCDEEKKLLNWGDILVRSHSWRLQDSKDAGH
jgi:hypothetical protein